MIQDQFDRCDYRVTNNARLALSTRLVRLLRHGEDKSMGKKLRIAAICHPARPKRRLLFAWHPHLTSWRNAQTVRAEFGSEGTAAILEFGFCRAITLLLTQMKVANG